MTINNTIIYFISRPIKPPSDVFQEMLPELEFSSFLAAVRSTTIGERIQNATSSTFLVPNNDAFKRIGLLVTAHLLDQSSTSDLEKLVLHHVLEGVYYTSSLQDGSQHSFSTLEGSDISLDRQKNATVVSPSGGWAKMVSGLYPRNILTRTGVIHELSDLMIPRSVDISVEKLVNAAKASTMASIVTRAGLGWILNGTAPPEDSPWARKGLGDNGWTLLCPTDDAFQPFNLTLLFADPEFLKMIVYQHLIPNPSGMKSIVDGPLNNNKPLVLDDSVSYSTLRSADSSYGDVVFRLQDDQYVVGIKGARGTDGYRDRAKVLSWGRSTTGKGTGGVIQIDRILLPYNPPWWIEYGAPSVFGVIGVIGILAFFYGVRVIWRRDTTEATYEPVGGFNNEDDD